MTQSDTPTNGVATPFDAVDVDEDVPEHGLAPEDPALTDAETAMITEQVEGITAANLSRTPQDQISVSPEDVN